VATVGIADGSSIAIVIATQTSAIGTGPGSCHASAAHAATTAPARLAASAA
jgi:hypothetical protein